MGLFTCQLYETPALSSGMNWNLLAIGSPGPASFIVTNTLTAQFFRAGVLTNY
jgi:hypothetical protein